MRTKLIKLSIFKSNLKNLALENILMKYLSNANIKYELNIKKHKIFIKIFYKEYYIHPFDIVDEEFIKETMLNIKWIYKNIKKKDISVSDILLPNTNYIMINNNILECNEFTYKNLILNDKKNEKAISSIVFIQVNKEAKKLVQYKIIKSKGYWELSVR